MIKFENDFNSAHTFDCGQCFRWEMSDNDYIGIASGKVCRVHDNELFCDDVDNEFWEDYFTLDVDYGAIKKALSVNDEKLAQCIEYGQGIRILKQDVWETTVSFIISANNNIPRIKKIILAMCELFGKPLEFEEKTYYSFPSAETISKLTVADLAPLRAGFRDKYIIDAAQKVANGEVNLNNITKLSTADAKTELMKIKGVGPKVADCVLLFSLKRFEVFPKDVWTKRILTDVYGIKEEIMDDFTADKYGENAGIAQQYLYYYYRDNSSK